MKRRLVSIQSCNREGREGGARIRTFAQWRAVGDTPGVGRPSASYTPKLPGQGLLYRVVREHFETFHAEAARAQEREALPGFIEEQ